MFKPLGEEFVRIQRETKTIDTYLVTEFGDSRAEKKTRTVSLSCQNTTARAVTCNLYYDEEHREKVAKLYVMTLYDRQYIHSVGKIEWQTVPVDVWGLFATLSTRW